MDILFAAFYQEWVSGAKSQLTEEVRPLEVAVCSSTRPEL